MAVTLLQSRMGSLLIIVVATLLAIWGLRYIGPIFTPVFFAFTLMVVLYPVLLWLMSKGIPKTWSVLIMVMSVLGFFGALFTIIFLSLNQLIAKLPEYQVMLAAQLEPIMTWLQSHGVELTGAPLGEIVNSQSIMTFILGFLSGLVSNVVYIGLFLFLLLLMIISAPDLAKVFKQHLGTNHPFLINFHEYAKLVQRQYGIQTFSNFISGAAIGLELIIFQIDFALLWGVLAFILGYIPNIGLIIATIPAMVLAFIQYGPWTALVVITIGFLLNQVMDNVVTPRFMGRGLEIPILFVFVSFLFWSWMFGPIGALISMPLTMALRSLLAGSKQTRLAAQVLSQHQPAQVEENVAPIK